MISDHELFNLHIRCDSNSASKMSFERLVFFLSAWHMGRQVFFQILYRSAIRRHSWRKKSLEYFSRSDNIGLYTVHVLYFLHLTEFFAIFLRALTYKFHVCLELYGTACMLNKEHLLFYFNIEYFSSLHTSNITYVRTK